jgi:hypothetical protein
VCTPAARAQLCRQPSPGVSTSCRAHHAPRNDARSKPGLLSFNSRVAVVGNGFIRLERDLPYNVSTAWSPALHNFERAWARAAACACLARQRHTHTHL